MVLVDIPCLSVWTAHGYCYGENLKHKFRLTSSARRTSPSFLQNSTIFFWFSSARTYQDHNSRKKWDMMPLFVLWVIFFISHNITNEWGIFFLMRTMQDLSFLHVTNRQIITCPVGFPGFMTTSALTVMPLDRASSSCFFSSSTSSPHPVSSSRK